MDINKALGRTRKALKLRNYSPKTTKSYLGCLSDYFNYVKTNLENSLKKSTIKSIKSPL